MKDSWIDAVKKNDFDYLNHIAMKTNLDIDEKDDDDGWTALHQAIYDDNFLMVQALLKYGANPDIKDEDGSSCFQWAAYKGDLKIIKEILKYKPNIDSQDSDGWAALMSAVQMGKCKAAELLMKEGADYTIKNNDGLNVETIRAPRKCQQKISEMIYKLQKIKKLGRFAKLMRD